MKKIININLYGRVIPIEDAAYDSLQRYIESLRRYFAAEEGRDEIINDIESRISELMTDKIKKGATCITEVDITDIISAMGRVEDFEAADRSENMGTTEASQANTGSATTGAAPHAQKPRFTGRLHRDADDKIIGGVCAGIANYANIDPAIVRLVFAIITFGGFGFGFFLYILLWIILPAKTLSTFVGKRFFRNPDDRIFGGVAGGLAAYFNKKAWTIRLIFAAPLILNIAFGIFNGMLFAFDRDIFPNFFIGSFSGTFILTYIILWIVLPEAKSQYEKMEMRGEKVDVNRIRQNVQEGIDTFGNRAKAWGEEVKSSAQNLSNKASEFAGGQGKTFAREAAAMSKPVASGIGHVIGVLFKSFFLFVAGVIAFSLFVFVLVFTFGGLAKPVNSFLLDGFWQKASMWGIIIFFLAVPLIGIITWIIRRVMKVRSQNKYLGWTFGGLWTLGWICIPLFISSMVKDFRYTERTEATIQLAKPQMNKLVVAAPESPIRYSGNFAWVTIEEESGWDISDDSLKLSNIRINVKQSVDSQYHVTLYRYSAGESRKLAMQRAEHILYNVSSLDSVLNLGSGFAVSEQDKFRGQKVMVEIQVPVGKQIRFDNSVGEKLNPYEIRVSETERSGRKRNWSRKDYRFEWDDNFYYDWEPDTDYYMTAEGKLKQVGAVDEEVPATPGEDSTDKQPAKANEASGENNDAKITDEEPTTYTKSVRSRIATPMPFQFIQSYFN